MDPGRPESRNAETATAEPTTAGARFVRTRSSTSSGSSGSTASRKTAALFTQPVNVPRSWAPSAAPCAELRSSALPTTAVTSGTSSVQLTAAASRSSTATGPDLASRSTMPRPTPRPPPVTTYDGRTGQRPRIWPRMPFIEVGTGPLGIGMLERLASRALIRCRTSVIWAGLMALGSLVTWRFSLPSCT